MSIRKPFFWLLLVMIGFFALAPRVTGDFMLLQDLSVVVVSIILVSNLNLMIGYTGYVNFGNIVFFGLGGYIGINGLYYWGWNPFLSALFAGAVVGLLTLLLGLGVLRLRGPFFALATIGVLEATKAFVSNFEPWQGAEGINLPFSVFDSVGGLANVGWYVYAALVGVMAASLFLSYWVKTSKFGLGLFAIREDEEAAQVLGVKAPLFKALVYAMSGVLPAVTGTLVAYKEAVIDPEKAFDLHRSIEAIVMLMLGGQGTIAGPILGAVAYEQLRSYLLTSEFFSHFHLIIAGGLLLLTVLFVPGGVMGWLYRQCPALRSILE